QALKVNYEWNIKLTSHSNGELIHHFNEQFESVWSEAEVLTETWIHRYEQQYVPVEYRRDVKQVADFPELYETNPLEEAIHIKPNKMQETALLQIESVR